MSTITDQSIQTTVDSLEKIYVYDTIGLAVYFQFENEEKVEAAARVIFKGMKKAQELAEQFPAGISQEKITDLTEPVLEVSQSHLTPKNSSHVIGYSPMQIGAKMTIVKTVNEFITTMTKVMSLTCQGKMHEVPIIKVTLNDLTPWVKI